MEIVDTFEFLLGTWSVERVIVDHCSGSRGLFQGVADVGLVAAPPHSRYGSHACYEEVGHFRFGAYEGRAGRRLDYVRKEDATVMFRFADGRRFVDCDLRKGTWHAFHPCGDDSYDLTFRVHSSNTMEEGWQVSGPSTHYEALATLRRVTAPKIGTGPSSGP